jgi:rod shape-determining protein MreC
METSRDDFVIAIRSAFLKKGTQQRFSLLSLIIFSILLLILGSINFKPINYLKKAIKEISYRSTFIVSIPEKLLKDSHVIIQNHNSLYKENKKNKSKLEDLKAENISKKIIEYENIRLKQIIDDYFIVENEIFAKTLIDKTSPFLKSIIINKGSKNNIELGMAVLDDLYFIGKIVEVNYTTSRVLLVSDINSKIPVLLEPNNVQAIMSGNGSGEGIIEYISEDKLENESEDLIVFTSGMSGLFKSGIPVGKIINTKNSFSDGLIVNFYKDLSQIKYVKILSFEKENFKSKIPIKEEVGIVNIEVIKDSTNETISLLKKQKEISDEIKLKFEDENSLLNDQLSKLKKEILVLQKNNENQKSKNEKNDTLKDNLKFLELNLLYGHKCRKTFYNQLYKVGTIKYRNCVMSKEKN